MSDISRRLIIGSAIVAAVAVLTSIVDLVIGFPYSGQTQFDISILISACLMFYMMYNFWKEAT